MTSESHYLDSIALPDLKIAKKVSLYTTITKRIWHRQCISAVSQLDLVAVMVHERLLKIVNKFQQSVCYNTGLFEMIVEVLATCHTQYTWDKSMEWRRWIKKFSRVFFMMCGVQYLCISPLGAQFTKMAANGGEKAFCVLTFHECRSVTIVTSRIRFMFLLSPQVYRNWRYESQPPLKPSPLTCYKQSGTNSIIVLMFVESQMVYI